MSPVELFIRRPIATTLLTIGITLAGALAFRQLPVSPLPQIDYPTISVNAGVPGASPEVMAATVATPLERALGRIAGITEMTSHSSDSSTSITLQFELSRDINGAAREVQAAINGARSLLPTSLTSNPTYRKINPSDFPILILALTSDTISRGRMFDAASTILAQKIAQVEGVGDVSVNGGSLPTVRVSLDPGKLAAEGVSLEAVRTAITKTNANAAKGFVEKGDQRWQIGANDQALTPEEYLPVIVSYKNFSPIHLSDVGSVFESVENIRNAANFNGKPSILIFVTRQPDANIIETVERVKAVLPNLQASIPAGINVALASDRSVTIRASLREVELTLALSIILVTLVVYLFLRDWRATLIPAVVVPVSLIGTFSVMYLLGFSLNNLSLMALTIATGFVVDDAIVVLENVARHIENGVPRFQAAIQGAEEVAFTVISVSVSLVAVFIPILLMSGLLGRLFREFAITLAVAILVSMVISLTTTPMMCARLLRVKKKMGDADELPGTDETATTSGVYGHSGKRDLVDWMVGIYETTLRFVLGHGFWVVLVLLITVGLNVYLYAVIPKGFFPQQDTGQVYGGIQADQSISFQAMREKVDQFAEIVRHDPAVASVNASAGGGGPRGGGASGSMFITLKPRSARAGTADDFVNRMRGKTAGIPGANLFLFPAQDIRAGGRSSAAQYQYTLQADDYAALLEWEPKIRFALAKMPSLTDVNTDAQAKGLQTTLIYDREVLSRLGLTIAQVNSILDDSFAQRQVSTLYKALNQYHVIMEVAPQFQRGPNALNSVYIVTPTGAQVPLSAIAHYSASNTALSVNHQGQFVASTISFNLAEGISLSQASVEIDQTMRQLGVPSSVRGSFQGTAKVFQDSLNSEFFLLIAAILAVYIVLGILYESLVHPLTILSTLPSAGIGALLALMYFRMEFTIIALIGVLLLIGIVKKNAILMIDFAIEAERRDNLSPRDAIFRAALLRFRPIMMTTLAALLGALPLAIGFGEGSELRQPLGVSIVGGLLVSQVLTLYTTPVVYVYFDEARLWVKRRRSKRVPNATAARSPA